jgi:hypothetical protein
MRMCFSLLWDARVFRDQDLKKCTPQRFAARAEVVHTREEPQGQRELLLGDPPMRTPPTAPQRPQPYHRMHRHFTQAVAISSARELAASVVDTLRVISPGTSTGIPT